MKYNILLIEPNNAEYDKTALNGPLGGSETVFLFLIDSLKKRDDVSLDVMFQNDDPEYYKTMQYDLVIAYRNPYPLMHIQGRINACLFQDMPSQGAIQGIQTLMNMGRLNRLIFLSHFQKEAYLAQLPPDLVHEARHCYMFENGLDMSIVNAVTSTDLPFMSKEKAFIYASAPNRGLDVLLKMWPIIHNLLPDYELRICGSTDMYNVPGNSVEVNAERQEFLATTGEGLYETAGATDGVKWLGGLSHAQVLQEMSKAVALLYPCTYPETSCQVLNMSLHVGCCPVVSQMGALVEKVVDGENGFMIPGDPTSNEFMQRFVGTLHNMIQSGTIDRINKTNKGMYTGWDMDRLTQRLVSIFLDFRNEEGDNHRILACCPSLRGNGKKNFANWRWYSPVDVQTDEIVGMPVDHARNVAANIAIHKEADWLLFIDDDIYTARNFVMDMIDTALKRNVEVVACNYYFKEDDGEIPVARVYRKSDYKTVDIHGMSEEELNGPDYQFVMTGLGACLISTRVLKKIGRPFFRTQCTLVRHTGEDSYFFQECRHLGIPVWLSVDIPVIHVGNGKVYGRKDHIDKIVGTLI